jgi:hypothetical protein
MKIIKHFLIYDNSPPLYQLNLQFPNNINIVIMKKTGLLFTSCFYFLLTFAQNSKYTLEINPFARFDRTSEFNNWETVTGGKNYIRPSGISYGVNVNLKRALRNNANIYAGLGFYRHTISNIKSRNSRGVTDDGRIINFLSPLFIFFYTDRYYYNTFSFNVGYERLFQFNKNYTLITGIDFNALYTYSQYYHLTRNPEGTVDYRRNNSTPFGLFAGIDVGLLKKYSGFSIGPKIKIPVFSMLKTDETFPNETGTDFRNQWFSGVGLGLSFIYHFKTKKL